MISSLISLLMLISLFKATLLSNFFLEIFLLLLVLLTIFNAVLFLKTTNKIVKIIPMLILVLVIFSGAFQGIFLEDIFGSVRSTGFLVFPLAYFVIILEENIKYKKLFHSFLFIYFIFLAIYFLLYQTSNRDFYNFDESFISMIKVAYSTYPYLYFDIYFYNLIEIIEIDT